MADIHILVADDAAGQRLDAYLGANDGCPTRSACAHLIEGGAVVVNGETCLSKKYAVRAGDRISVDLPEPLGPTKPIFCPALTLKLIFLRISGPFGT